MARVSYDSITKKFEDTTAVDDVDLTIEDGEFAVLLGPSGCGKTTTLRCLAGLETPTAGEIRIDEADVTDTHPKDRDIAMVFQNLALYPHMTVRENIGYPLAVAGVDADRREERVAEIAEMLEIPELLDRDVDQVSGGQQQRVAIGRAIIRRPEVFLMDEPLASLDAKLKVEMRNRVKVLQRELDITTLYVTHDQEEAMTLADKIAVMDDGRIQQVGSPNEIYHEPANRFVAGFIGAPSMNFVEVEWTDSREVSSLAAPDEVSLRLEEPVAERYDDVDRFTLGIRPQYFDVHTSPTPNSIACQTEVTEPTGDDQIVTAYPGDSLDGDIELTIRAPADVRIERGDTVWLTVRDDRVHGFDSEGERIVGEARHMATRASP
jgi:multiple sugar transport system ATP-binding protein